MSIHTRVVVSRLCGQLSDALLCVREVEPSIQLVTLLTAGIHMQSVERCCQSNGDELSVGVLPASPSERANCMQYVETSCQEISC